MAAREKADELEKENLDMATKLAKKEQELDLRTQEKVLLNISFTTSRHALIIFKYQIYG